MNYESIKSFFYQSGSPLVTTLMLVSLVLASILLGSIFELLIKKYGNKIASMTKWKFDDYLISSLRGTILPLSIVLTVYISSYLVKDLQSIQALIHKGCFTVAAFITTLIIARFTSKMVRHLSSSAAAPLPSTFLSNLTSVLVFIIGTLVTLQTFGVSIAPILTTLGIGGLAVALALQDTLANLFSGLYILLSKQVRLGDYVKLDSGNEGYISDITWRNTVIKTLQNNLVIIPNSKLASAIITNFNLPAKEISFSIEMGIEYGSDLTKVEEITTATVKEVLKTIPGGVSSFEPFIRYHTFGPYSINFSIILKANEYVDQYTLKHECIKKLHERYLEENIGIPYPIQTVQLKQQAAPQITTCIKD